MLWDPVRFSAMWRESTTSYWSMVVHPQTEASCWHFLIFFCFPLFFHTADRSSLTRCIAALAHYSSNYEKKICHLKILYPRATEKILYFAIYLVTHRLTETRSAAIIANGKRIWIFLCPPWSSNSEETIDRREGCDWNTFCLVNFEASRSFGVEEYGFIRNSEGISSKLTTH